MQDWHVQDMRVQAKYRFFKLENANSSLAFPRKYTNIAGLAAREFYFQFSDTLHIISSSPSTLISLPSQVINARSHLQLIASDFEIWNCYYRSHLSKYDKLVME